MKIALRTILVAAMFAGTTTAIADSHQAMEKPSFYASQSETVTAQVKAIDHKTREVTLKRADGEMVTFTASEEARNLDQVSVGDMVFAEYIEKVSVKVMANDGGEPAAAGLTTLGRSEKGEMPGMAAVDTQVITATVEDINLEANTFKLKGPLGNVEEYVAMNPENLKRAAVGDMVVITITEALAISVEKNAAE